MIDPKTLKIGSRIEWIYPDEDSDECHKGTVDGISETISVIWDDGHTSNEPIESEWFWSCCRFVAVHSNNTDIQKLTKIIGNAVCTTVFCIEKKYKDDPNFIGKVAKEIQQEYERNWIECLVEVLQEALCIEETGIDSPGV